MAGTAAGAAGTAAGAAGTAAAGAAGNTYPYHKRPGTHTPARISRAGARFSPRMDSGSRLRCRVFATAPAAAKGSHTRATPSSNSGQYATPALGSRLQNDRGQMHETRVHHETVSKAVIHCHNSRGIELLIYHCHVYLCCAAMTFGKEPAHDMLEEVSASHQRRHSTPARGRDSRPRAGVFTNSPVLRSLCTFTRRSHGGVLASN